MVVGRKCLLEEADRLCLIGEPFSNYDSLGWDICSNCSRDTLWLLAGDNSIEAVSLYIFALMHGIPMILEDWSRGINKALIENFCPEYLLLPHDFKFKIKDDTYLDYIFWGEYGHYSIFKLRDKCFWSEKKIKKNVALLLSTSGSVGCEKLVVLSRKNLVANAKSIVDCLQITSSERGALMLPMAYSYGLSVINSHILADAYVILPKGNIMQSQYWDELESLEATSICGVPYTYEIIRKLKVMERPLKNLRLITQAGGNLSRYHKEYFYKEVMRRRKLGQEINFAVMYGQTEATARMSSFFLNQFPDKIESVGKPISGGRFHINKNEFEREGEIVYEGANVSMGYAYNWRDLMQDSSCEKESGKKLYTGDIGYLDEDGFLYITGRKKRFVKIRGRRYGLDEMQTVLSELLEREVVCVLEKKEDKERVMINISKGKKRETSLLEKCLIGEMGLRHKDFILRWDSEIKRKMNGKVDYNAYL